MNPLLELNIYTLSIPLLEHQKSAVHWMKMRENKSNLCCVGGLLADEMGLGKTMDCIALIVSDEIHIDTCTHTKLTLIVVPSSLLYQWKEEIITKTNIPENCIALYHGTKKEKSIEAIQEGKVFIVLVSYDGLREENTLRKSVLLGHSWHRVILDEAHRIRNQCNKTTKTVLSLQSRRRWVVTGTPFNNSLSDLATLASFIKVPPYNATEWWNAHKNDTKAIQQWTQNYVLQRRKNILPMKPLKDTIVEINFTLQERNLYKNIFHEMYRKYEVYHRSLHKNQFTAVLTHILALRQICNHPLLLLGKEWILQQKTIQTTECSHCKTKCTQKKIKLLECGHGVCNQCSSESSLCNLCTKLSFWMKRNGEYVCSSKIIAIVEYCKKILTETTEKIVIFSQWTSFLDILEHFMKPIEFCRYDGNVPVESRNSVIREFNQSASKRVLLCSLLCGCVGLNLQIASRVVMCDLWYNPYIEKQAIDRVNRIGQKNNVEVVHFIMKGSIEDSVRHVQNKKLLLGDNVLFGNKSADSSSKKDDFVDIHAIFKRIFKKNGIKRILSCEEEEMYSSKRQCVNNKL